MDDPDDEHLQPGVNLMHDGAQHHADLGPVAELTVQQFGHVGQAHVFFDQLFIGQHADAAGPLDAVALEGEIDFLDAQTFGLASEFGFCALGCRR